MLLAELVVRHTRRHMPTRRVALDGALLPTGRAAHGPALLAAVVGEHAWALDDEQRDDVPALLAAARRGLAVPRIALRHRLQTDVHGLDRSRHRLLLEGGRAVVELDVHGAPVPQVLGAVLAAAALPPTPRGAALAAVAGALDGWTPPAGVSVRRLHHGLGWVRPPAPDARGRGRPRRPAPGDDERWARLPPDRRWAMGVLGLAVGAPCGPVEVNRRYRRLLRAVHPDHGGASEGAAERIAELAEARALLLAAASAAAWGRG